MKRPYGWIVGALILPIAACTHGQSASAQAPAPTPAAPAHPPLSQADQTFVQQAAIGGMAEVQLAQLAQQKTKNPAINSFAAQMIQDHTPNNQQLIQLAQQKGLTPPTTLDPQHQAELQTLQGESGARFNHDYIDGQITDHKQMLQIFQTEVQDGQDPDLKSFAQQTIPVIQHHIEMAQQIAMSHGGRRRHHAASNG